MKEIIYIVDYSNTLEKQINLLNLIKGINREVYDVCVSSHCVLSEWIIGLCDYYFYDKENEVINTPLMKSYYYFNTDKVHITYKPWFVPSAYIIPIFRLILPTYSFLKILGYKIVHTIEYDCEILNYNEFKNNSLLLDKYDMVGYVEKHNQSLNSKINNSIENINWIHGNLISINLTKFNFQEFIYDKEKMLDILDKKHNEHYSYCQEKTGWEYIWKSKNIYAKPLEDIKKSLNNSLVGNSKLETLKIENTIALYINKSNKYQFFVNSKKKSYKIQLIIDSQKTHNFTTTKDMWHLFDINTPDTSIQVIIDGITIKSFNLNNKLDIEYINSTTIDLN